MAAVIAAVPRMRRILSPLCFMLKMEARLLRPPPPAPPANGEATVVAEAASVELAQTTIAPDEAPPVMNVHLPDAHDEIFSPA
jgi:hypothetical protein